METQSFFSAGTVCGGQRLLQAGEVDQLHVILLQLCDDFLVGEQPQFIRSRSPQSCFEAVQFGVLVTGMAHQLARAGGQSIDQINQSTLSPGSGARDSDILTCSLSYRYKQLVSVV